MATQMSLMDMSPEQMDAYFNSRQQYYGGRQREYDLAELARLREDLDQLTDGGVGAMSVDSRRKFLLDRINELNARTAAAPAAAPTAAMPTVAERVVAAPVAAMPVAQTSVAPAPMSARPSIDGLLADAPVAPAAPAAKRSQSIEGLLGSLFGGNELEDLMTPQQRAAINQRGLLAAAAALLQAGGPSTRRISLGQALGSAIEAGQTGAERAQQSALTQMLTRQKLDEARQEALATQGFRSALEGMRGGGAAPAMTPAQALAAPGLPSGPTVARAQMIGRPAPAGMGAPGARVLTDAQIDLLKNLPRREAAAELLKLTQPAAPSDKAKLLGELGMPVTIENLQRLEKPEASPSEIRTLRETGTPVTLQNVMNLRRAGAASTTVNLPGNKEFVSGAASQAIKTLDEMTQNARAAVSTLSTIERIAPAIDTAVIGPAADYRTTMLRIGQQLGVAGQNESERLANTRTVVQGLAQLELEAAQQMRGQGALTDAERGILRRAAAGDQTLSAPELRSALATAKKVATARIEAQRDYLNRAMKIEDFKPFAPLYEITTPSSGAAPSLLNSLDAEIQRRQQQTQPQRGR